MVQISEQEMNEEHDPERTFTLRLLRCTFPSRFVILYVLLFDVGGVVNPANFRELLDQLRYVGDLCVILGHGRTA